VTSRWVHKLMENSFPHKKKLIIQFSSIIHRVFSSVRSTNCGLRVETSVGLCMLGSPVQCNQPCIGPARPPCSSCRLLSRLCRLWMGARDEQAAEACVQCNDDMTWCIIHRDKATKTTNQYTSMVLHVGFPIITSTCNLNAMEEWTPKDKDTMHGSWSAFNFRNRIPRAATTKEIKTASQSRSQHTS